MIIHGIIILTRALKHIFKINKRNFYPLKGFVSILRNCIICQLNIAAFGGSKSDTSIFYSLKLEIFNGSNFCQNSKETLKIKIKPLVASRASNIN